MVIYRRCRVPAGTYFFTVNLKNRRSALLIEHGDSNYSGRWQSIKSHFTRHLKKRIKLYKNKHGEYGIWQRRYWEHMIRDEDDLNRHIDYIHYNPVKHGYVNCVKEWEYSSFHRFVQKQRLPLDWGDNSQTSLGQYGE